jgi:hypothetical protein
MRVLLFCAQLLVLSCLTLIESSIGAPLLTLLFLFTLLPQYSVWVQAGVILLWSIVFGGAYFIAVSYGAAVLVAGLFFLEKGSTLVKNRVTRVLICGVVGSGGVVWNGHATLTGLLGVYYFFIVGISLVVLHRLAQHRARRHSQLLGSKRFSSVE